MNNLQKQVFDLGIPYSYVDLIYRNICLLLMYLRCFIIIYRQMRGEELEGLSVEELQLLEKNLESGLHRVLQTKVW
jgi:hypothetical protein